MSRQVAAFVSKARSAFYREGETKPLPTFDVWAEFGRARPAARAAWAERLAGVDGDQVRELLDRVPRHRMTPQRLSFLTHPPSGQPVNNLYLQTDMGVVDVLSSVLGVGDFPRLRDKAEELEIDGRTYRVISLEDLIIAKEAMGREKDLLTVKELRAIQAKRQFEREKP